MTKPATIRQADIARADYDVLKRAGYTRAEALRAIGREDLIRGGRP